MADAGPDQDAVVGETVTLDNSGSYDPDGDLLTYEWSLTSVLEDSGALLSDPTAVDPVFTVDARGDYVAQLIVHDGTLPSAPDTVLVTTENSRPVADAGPDQIVKTGDVVQLDGGGSTDTDGDPLVVTDSPALFTGCSADADIHFDPLAEGTTTLSITQPAGFSAPPNELTTLVATVRAAEIQLTSPIVVGQDLQVYRAVILVEEPPEPVELTITIADETKALLSASRTAMGSRA